MGSTHTDVAQRFINHRPGKSGSYDSWGSGHRKGEPAAPPTLVSDGERITYYRTQLAHWDCHHFGNVHKLNLSLCELVWDVNPYWYYKGGHSCTSNILSDMCAFAKVAGYEVPGGREYTGQDLYLTVEEREASSARDAYNDHEAKKRQARSNYANNAEQREHDKCNARNCQNHGNLGHDGREDGCFRCVVSWQTYGARNKAHKARREAIKAEHEGHDFRWTRQDRWNKKRHNYDPDAYFCWTCEDTYRDTHFCQKHHWGGAPSNEPECDNCAAVAAGYTLVQASA